VREGFAARQFAHDFFKALDCYEKTKFYFDPLLGQDYMARPLRIEYPGAFYHTINRGNAGEKIFKNKGDRKKFLEYVEKAVERFSIIIHAYCLMDTHYHILMETPEPNLSVAVQWINVSYAVYFNKKHQRNGHLFQGRFKAILIDADEYLKELSRYIHLNPVRAKVVATPSDYPWTSYHAFIGKEKKPDWLETEWLLSQFGRRRKDAVRSYKSYVEQVEATALRNPHKEVVGGLILGDRAFVEWIKEAFLSARNEEEEIPQLRELKPRPSLESIVEVVGDEMRCSEEEILEKGLNNNIGREMAIYLARDLSGTSCKALGKYFGGISGPGISRNYNHFAGRLAGDRRLKGKVNKIKRRLIIN
jgi:REP element-mobilizing transposase RayT